MAKTTVYKVRLYNPLTDEPFLSRRMATAEGARLMRGDILEETAYVIDMTDLEAGEEWTARDFDPVLRGGKKL